MDYLAQPASTQAVIAALGIGPMRERLGKSYKMINATANSGSFPAKWFVVISNMCSERGIECPRELFSFDADETEIGKRVDSVSKDDTQLNSMPNN